MPNPMANTMAANVSSTVAGKRRLISLVTERWVVRVAVSPPVMVVRLLGIAACMAKRGSGPCRRLVTVLSASVVF